MIRQEFIKPLQDLNVSGSCAIAGQGHAEVPRADPVVGGGYGVRQDGVGPVTEPFVDFEMVAFEP